MRNNHNHDVSTETRLSQYSACCTRLRNPNSVPSTHGNAKEENIIPELRKEKQKDSWSSLASQ